MVWSGSIGKWSIFDRFFTFFMIGHLSTGHLSKLSIKNAKVALKMVIVSSYIGKHSSFTYAQILNEKIYIFFKVNKVGLQVNLQLGKVERPRRKYFLKARQTCYGQKGHRV